MARRKQRAVEPEEEPQMNMSSMMDACFLLLIYFIVAESPGSATLRRFSLTSEVATIK